MNAIHLAKRRAALRRHEGGAVMFIVAMMIAVLGSVGVYALAAAATEVRTSGNERQNTQTHYLAEYSIVAAAQVASIPGVAQKYHDMLIPPSKLQKPVSDTCLSLASVPTTAAPAALACHRVEMSEFTGFGKWSSTVLPVDPYTSAPYTPNVNPGSFGATPMNGDFFVEINEASEMPATGFSSMQDVLVSVTAYARTQPLYPSIAGADTSVYGGEGVEVQRAHFIMGPVQKPPSSH